MGGGSKGHPIFLHGWTYDPVRFQHFFPPRKNQPSQPANLPICIFVVGSFQNLSFLQVAICIAYLWKPIFNPKKFSPEVLRSKEAVETTKKLFSNHKQLCFRPETKEKQLLFGGSIFAELVFEFAFFIWIPPKRKKGMIVFSSSMAPHPPSKKKSGN